METAKTLKMMISFNSWIMLLLLPVLLHTLGVDGCLTLDPLSILKTIENVEDGETIHCVDIYKQPAFSHPQLRNHTIQMKPSSDLFGLKSKSSLDSNSSSGLYLPNWHKKGEYCPEGTIPILKSSREDFPQKTSVDPLDSGLQKPRGAKEYAVAFLPRPDVHGASADMNLWNPIVWPREYSASQIWVTDGEGKNINTVEAGYLVNPDHLIPQLFIYWTTDNYGTTGCYNLCCGGFVQTSDKIVLGGKILPYSIYRGTQRAISISIKRDYRNGNWWLTYNGVAVGYWPPSIFTGGLKTSASLIAWGGEVLNSNAGRTHTSTQMGSGHMPGEGWEKAAYFKNLKFVTAEGQIKYSFDIQALAKRPDCYDIKVKDPDGFWGVNFYYGGPGASPTCR